MRQLRARQGDWWRPENCCEGGCRGDGVGKRHGIDGGWSGGDQGWLARQKERRPVLLAGTRTIDLKRKGVERPPRWPTAREV
ncbi:hypothetical protein Veis_3665 [Verminephrobacter eiseniae EF01-2]|uniref:Uncharacterized protein n=1 Tax=Verminephrobacter eiseniae (strain EF01-2) TaxID=391735 RepID=A1WP24_VEREI|nr:hypothetical protein Veis_3665 [Verminephrobacter eiseniae EF01-2]